MTRADADRARLGSGEGANAHTAGDEAERQRGLRGSEVAGGVLLGIGGGTLFAFAGAYTGAYLATRQRCSGEDCDLAAAVLGFFVGESVGVAAGTHIGAGGKGNLLLETVVTTAITAAGVAVVSSSHGAGAGQVMLGLVPLAQLAAVLAIEAH